jgi:L-2-hydroxyglutarate oxidase
MMGGMEKHIVIAGAGIVGLATAYELTRRGCRVTVLDKETTVASHQSGNNSGVIHSGLYYAPGSLKAELGVAGARSMMTFARAYGVAAEATGKLVVATRDDQLPALQELHRRGEANGVPCRMLTVAEAREFEPAVNAVGALRVESTGIIDYRGVCEVLAAEVKERGGELDLGVAVKGVRRLVDGVKVLTDRGPLAAQRFVNCCGLQADLVARQCGVDPGVRIVPFRGEYYKLAEHQTHLVRGLIYPVPDPALPFLGVHLTRMIGGGVHAGPNAVLALAREGYSWKSINPREIAQTLAFPGLWKLGRTHWQSGLAEFTRSLSRPHFLASLRELVPALAEDALLPAPAGVRAQALRPDGTLVQDFHLVEGPHQLHVLNAPSPAATAALEIGKHLADRLNLSKRP